MAWPVYKFDAVTYTFYSIAVLTTTLRVFVRARILRAFWLDDILAIIATLLGAVVCTLDHYKIYYNDLWLKAVEDGEPPESGLVTPRLFFEAARYGVWNVIFYVIQLGLIKIAILAFYYRLVSGKKHRYVLYGTGTLIITWTAVFITATCLMLQSSKLLSATYSDEISGSLACPCDTLAIANSCFQATFDILIIVYPVPIFRKMKLDRRTRIGLIIVYCLGFFTLATTLIRLGEGVRYTLLDSLVEKLQDCLAFSIWAIVEANTALICANLPALFALFKWIYRSHQESTKAKSSYTKDTYPSQKNSAYCAMYEASNKPDHSGILCTKEFSAHSVPSRMESV